MSHPPPASASLMQHVLIVKKPGDADAAQALYDIALWLHAHGKCVHVEREVRHEDTAAIGSLTFLESWPAAAPAPAATANGAPPAAVAPPPPAPRSIDLVVCLGGDGTLLWASNLFKAQVPPVISFALGSLGFLSPFPLDVFPEALSRVFGGRVQLTMRNRLVCTIVRGRRTGAGAATGAQQGSSRTRRSSVQTPAAASAGEMQATTAAAEAAAAANADAQQPPLSVVHARHHSLSAQGYALTQPMRTPLRAATPSVLPTAVHEAEEPVPESSLPASSIAEHDCGSTLDVPAGLSRRASASPPLLESSSLAAATAALALHQQEDVASAAAAALELELACTEVESFVCLNEVIVDRGLSAYLTLLDCYVDGMLFTRVQADGLIVATPTGSTAYSLSAGGSMCHPGVPCMLFTPVCPHSLSFRPLLFPDSSTLQIAISADSRGTNCASFDGRHRATLEPGDSLLVSMSRWPLPSVCNVDGTADWFDGVRSVLQWNSRSASQKPLHPSASPAGAASAHAHAHMSAAPRRASSAVSPTHSSGTAAGPSIGAYLAANSASSRAAAAHASAAGRHYLVAPQPSHALTRLSGVHPIQLSDAPAPEEQCQSAPPARDTPHPQA